MRRRLTSHYLAVYTSAAVKWLIAVFEVFTASVIESGINIARKVWMDPLSFPRSGVGMQWGTLLRPVPLERYSGIPTPERGNDVALFTSGSIN